MRRILFVLRYRFLLMAGLMPYFLGSAASIPANSFDVRIFLLGLAGAVLALIGVEAYNEFFEGRTGVDLVFDVEPRRVPSWTFALGTAAFAAALLIAGYLASVVGPLILALVAYGSVAAAFYVGPPIRWAYRGFGEAIIALAYGPFMTLGGYYLQISRLDTRILLLSLVPGFLTFATVLSNEVPQRLGDSLVGKMNLVVRLGERGASVLHRLSLALAYASLVVLATMGIAPPLALAALATLPLAAWTMSASARYCEHPRLFVKAIRGTVAVYTLVLAILSLSYYLAAWVSLEL